MHTFAYMGVHLFWQVNCLLLRAGHLFNYTAVLLSIVTCSFVLNVRAVGSCACDCNANGQAGPINQNIHTDVASCSFLTAHHLYLSQLVL